MNRYKLIKAGVDANEALEKFSFDPSFYEKMLMKFKEDDVFEKMCKAVEAHDVVNGFSYAHSLKGEVGNLSMTRLYKSVCLLVEELRAGRTDKLDEYLEVVKADYAAVIEALS